MVGKLLNRERHGVIALVGEEEVGSMVIDPDAEAAFGVGYGAMAGIPHLNGDVREGGAGYRVQNGSGDRSGLAKTGMG